MGLYSKFLLANRVQKGFLCLERFKFGDHFIFPMDQICLVNYLYWILGGLRVLLRSVRRKVTVVTKNKQVDQVSLDNILHNLMVTFIRIDMEYSLINNEERMQSL